MLQKRIAVGFFGTFWKEFEQQIDTSFLRTNISSQKGTFEDYFPFPKVWYVSFQEGITHAPFLKGTPLTSQVESSASWKSDRNLSSTRRCDTWEPLKQKRQQECHLPPKPPPGRTCHVVIYDIYKQFSGMLRTQNGWNLKLDQSLWWSSFRNLSVVRGGRFLLKFHASYDSYYFILLMTEILHQLKVGSVSHGAVYIPAG